MTVLRRLKGKSGSAMVSRRVSYGPPRTPSSTWPLAALVRRHDPDRFLTALFAPAEQRPALFALYAFNHELARAREVTKEPAIALIRLHWWREVVQGAQRAHEVAAPLRAALDAGALAEADLLGVIDAREVEVDPHIETLDDWRAYLLGSAGGVAVAAARLLRAASPEAFRPLGAAFGAAGVLRSTTLLARQQRCLLPAEVLAAHGLTPYDVIAAPAAPSVGQAIAALADEARRFLAGAPHPGRGDPALAAALPAVLAARDLGRAPHFAPYRTLADRLAVTRAGLFGL